MIKFEFKTFDELTNYELYELLRIRSEVFIVEQTCAFNDIDNKDFGAVHLMLKDSSNNNKMIGCLRLLNPGVSFDASSIGRVLISPQYRGQGLAKKLMKSGINYLFNNLNQDKITIGAQHYLLDFYTSFGFTPISEVYYEDDILHLDMSLVK